VVSALGTFVALRQATPIRPDVFNIPVLLALLSATLRQSAR